MHKLICLLGTLINILIKFSTYCRKQKQKSIMEKCGKNVYIGSGCIMTEKNISIGNNVYIGPRCIFQSSFGKIHIGNHVMFGPGVNIHGGNHKIREVGVYLDDVSSKNMGDDGVISIGDDCWIGANAIILANVSIGTGSVIGAGSVVTKNIPPYSIYTGSQEPVLRKRFTKEIEKIHINNIINRYRKEI